MRQRKIVVKVTLFIMLHQILLTINLVSLVFMTSELISGSYEHCLIF